jgi:2-dehydropantoate 2-reductase
VKTTFIVGAGGIGCAVGYALRAAGLGVTFVDADSVKLADGKRHGVRVNHLPPLSADFIHFEDWRPSNDATVLLCTKCYDNGAVLERLTDSTQLLPIQNGFDRNLDARGHAWEGIASFVSECRPGRTHTFITRRGELHIGNRLASGGRKPPVDVASEPATSTGGLRPPLAALQQTSLFKTVLVPGILPYKYTKLMYNAAISPLAAAAGLDNGELLSVPLARWLFFGLLRENYAILKGAAIPLAKIGPFHPDTVQWILRHQFVANSLAWAFYPSLRGSYCSMSGDLPKGRTEIDYYNGHLIEVAGERPCPLNRRVCDLLKRMEEERRKPQTSMLDELRCSGTVGNTV